MTGVSTDLSKKPKVGKISGSAPTELQGSDVVEGTGAAAKSGDKVDMQYVGVLFNGGKQFDASWDRGKKPFTFTIGQGAVIKGWDEGIPGMRVGGVRQLTIPPSLGYGTKATGKIPAFSTLHFEVELLEVNP